MSKNEEKIFCEERYSDEIIDPFKIATIFIDKPITHNDFVDVVEKQFYELIEKINKKLMKSLKKNPVGYGKCKIRVESKDMRHALTDYYDKLGYSVDTKSEMYWFFHGYKHYLIIEIKDWRR